jgi:hypothetical protein
MATKEVIAAVYDCVELNNERNAQMYTIGKNIYGKERSNPCSSGFMIVLVCIFGGGSNSNNYVVYLP